MHGKHASSFNENITKIRDLIEHENLHPGQRLPSERELAETLAISRASVREALRALSFLGIVETRRGGGTFIREQDRHRYIEIIAEFIVTKQTKAEDIVEMLRLLERLSISQIEWNEEMCEELSKCIDHDRLFRTTLISFLRNELFIRIWHELNRFYVGSTQEDLYTREERQQLWDLCKD